MERNLISEPDTIAEIGRFRWGVGRYQIKRMFPCDLERKMRNPKEPIVGGVAEDALFGVHDAKQRTYSPLEDNPDLFTNFAELDSEAAVLRFANSYGHLGIPRKHYAPNGLQKSVELEPGEPIIPWLTEAAQMSSVVDLWERITSGNLDGVIRWRRDAVCYFKPGGGGFSLIASATGRHASFFHLWRRGELEGPARLLVASQINAHLRESVAPQLAFDDSQQFREYTRPLNLLGAIWYQMLRAYTGRLHVKRCPECGGWITYQRSTKVMHEKCAAKARQRKYREAHHG